MSSELQDQPNVSQQQPFMAYPSPNAITAQPLPPSHSHSNGSFGTVFIVLAAIVVVSAVACCVGRFCNRRQNSRPKQSYPTSSRPPKENDVEFGFDKKINSLRRENHVEFGFDKKANSHRRDNDVEFGFDKKKFNNHEMKKPNQSHGGSHQDKDKEMEFAFDMKARKPKVPGNGEFGSGYKPSMDNGFRHGSRHGDEI